MPGPQTDLLKGLSEAEAAEVMALGTPVTSHSGETVFRMGDAAERVYLLQKGRVALTLPMQLRGAEQDVLIEERLPGETMGWSGLIPPHRFTLKATAQVESEMLAFDRDTLLKHFATNPRIGYTIATNVAAVIGHRLGVFQTMWLREMQRVVELRYE